MAKIKGQRPPKQGGMRHVALRVKDLAAMEFFYIELMGMAVEWRPDADNVYLSSGNDNVALHVVPERLAEAPQQSLDHIGFIIPQIDDVSLWYEFLLENEVMMQTEPRTHRDGARSFYCYDPDGNVVQIIYHPPIS